MQSGGANGGGGSGSGSRGGRGGSAGIRPFIPFKDMYPGLNPHDQSVVQSDPPPVPGSDRYRFLNHEALMGRRCIITDETPDLKGKLSTVITPAEFMAQYLDPDIFYMAPYRQGGNGITVRIDATGEMLVVPAAYLKDAEFDDGDSGAGMDAPVQKRLVGAMEKALGALRGARPDRSMRCDYLTLYVQYGKVPRKFRCQDPELMRAVIAMFPSWTILQFGPVFATPCRGTGWVDFRHFTEGQVSDEKIFKRVKEFIMGGWCQRWQQHYFDDA